MRWLVTSRLIWIYTVCNGMSFGQPGWKGKEPFSVTSHFFTQALYCPLPLSGLNQQTTNWWFFFLIFPRKQDLAFHATCLPEKTISIWRLLNILHRVLGVMRSTVFKGQFLGYVKGRFQKFSTCILYWNTRPVAIQNSSPELALVNQIKNNEVLKTFT